MWEIRASMTCISFEFYSSYQFANIRGVHPRNHMSLNHQTNFSYSVFLSLLCAFFHQKKCMFQSRKRRYNKIDWCIIKFISLPFRISGITIVQQLEWLYTNSNQFRWCFFFVFPYSSHTTPPNSHNILFDSVVYTLLSPTI